MAQSVRRFDNEGAPRATLPEMILRAFLPRGVDDAGVIVRHEREFADGTLELDHVCCETLKLTAPAGGTRRMALIVIDGRHADTDHDYPAPPEHIEHLDLGGLTGAPSASPQGPTHRLRAAAVWTRGHYFVHARGQRGWYRLDDAQCAGDTVPDYQQNAPEGGPLPPLGAGQYRHPRPTLLLHERQEPTQLSTSVR